MSAYTEKQLYEFMDARRPVKVTCTDGTAFSGMCWAYSRIHNQEEEGRDEASIEIGDTAIYLSEIQSIEFCD